MNKRTIWGIANDWRRWTLKSKALNLILEIFTMEISFQFIIISSANEKFLENFNFIRSEQQQKSIKI